MKSIPMVDDTYLSKPVDESFHSSRNLKPRIRWEFYIVCICFQKNTCWKHQFREVIVKELPH